MFFGNKRKNTELEIQIYDAIEKLEAGETSYLKIAYEAMAFDNREIVKKAAHGIKKCLETATAKQMITLSERFREYTSLDWFVDWKNVDIKGKKAWFGSEQEYVYALIVGSFHPNGYFREVCSKELSNYPNTLGYMLLRVNDWVAPIRENMFVLALKRLENCTVMELFLSIQHMEKLSRSGRVDYEEVTTLKDIFYRRIEESLPDFPLEKIKYFEFATRKMIYRLLIKKRILNLSQINYLLEREKHSFCKQILITGTLQYYDCSKEQVEKYLRDKSGIVRRRALEYQYSVVKNYWDGLEMMLLDKNKGVREWTVYIISHHTDINILNFYISHLQDENPIDAIVGVGEQGDEESGKLLLPFLQSPVHKVVGATLRALAKTIGMEGYDIYHEYLVNEEVSVSKAAYYAICYCTIHYGAEKLYHDCVQYTYPHVKRYALSLLIRENSWNRLPFLLELYGREDFKEYQDLILGAIASRDMYGTISKEQEEKINKNLKEKEHLLPKHFVKEIRFDMKFVVEK